MRYYRCPTCKSKFEKLAQLNQHYKDLHPPLTCKDCDGQFSTPSTLEQHSYKHKELKFTCKVCGKGFPFVSNRDSHELSHTTDKTFKCNKCDKAYINKGGLVKHERLIPRNFGDAGFVTTPIKMSVTSKLICASTAMMPYICDKCLKLFKYHTQWKRHLPCDGKVESKTDENKNKKTPLKCSNSPDY